MSGVDRDRGPDLPFGLKRRALCYLDKRLRLDGNAGNDQTFDKGAMVRGSPDAGVPGLHEDVRSSSGGGRSPNKSGRAAEAIASSQPSLWIGFRQRAKRGRFGDPFLNLSKAAPQ